jgi:hypothetical protein
MNRILNFVVPALGGLLVCSPTCAQMRGARASASPIPTRPLPPTHMATIVRPPGNSVAQPATGGQANRQVLMVHVIHIAPNPSQTPNTRPFENTVSFESENEVPGLGFDYPHLAAISGNFPFNPPVEGVGRGAHNFVTPIFFGGNPYFSGPIDTSGYQPVQQQPQIIVIQQPAPAAGTQPTSPVPQALVNSAVSSTTTPSSSLPPPTPVPDVGEFILVRRDGRVLFASVFYVSGGQLHYVTPEGIRHTVSVTELDSNATHQMNDALGSAVQIHN